MSIDLHYAFKALINETFTVGVDGSETPTITYASFDDVVALSATSTPPVDTCVVRKLALTAGAYTIDLTTITGANGAVQNSTGKKVQLFRFKNLGANSMTIAEGATFGYPMLGTSFTFTVPAGGQVMFVFNDNAPDVASGDRQIDIAGTGSQEFELTLVTG